MKRARASIRHQLRPSVYLEMGHGPATQPYHTQPAPSTPIPGAAMKKALASIRHWFSPKRGPRDGARACVNDNNIPCRACQPPAPYSPGYSTVTTVCSPPRTL